MHSDERKWNVEQAVAGKGVKGRKKIKGQHCPSALNAIRALSLLSHLLMACRPFFLTENYFSP
jgi:hypothetical protein